MGRRQRRLRRSHREQATGALAVRAFELVDRLQPADVRLANRVDEVLALNRRQQLRVVDQVAEVQFDRLRHRARIDFDLAGLRRPDDAAWVEDLRHRR